MPNEDKKAEWEKALYKQASDEKNITLLEKRKLADFYGTRGLDSQKAHWLNQIVKHLQQEPSRDNFYLIADWCLKTTGVFLQNTEEAQENIGLRASTTVALLIWRGLASSTAELENASELESMTGYDKHTVYQWFLKGVMDFSPILEPLIEGNNPTGDALRKIAQLFQTNQRKFAKK